MKFQRVPHVVIVGGGFGGLYAARALARSPVRITRIDKRNHHLFQPLLYQVATGGLDASDIAAPIRRILAHQKNATVLMGRAVAVDRERKVLQLTDREISYDFLILATGATHAYFGHDDWARHAPGLKTVEDALAIQRKVLLAYEAAEVTSDPEKRKQWLTFVVVGAGPTGVELAGALGEIAHRTLAQDFRNFDTRETRVLLLDGSDRVLGAYDPDLSVKADKQLADLGVEIRCDTKVTHVDSRGVIANDERIAARTVVWAAGVRASRIGASLECELDRAGRVLVSPELTVPGCDDLFVIGDLAALKQDGEWLPGVAPVAIQMGRHVARAIERVIEEQPLEPFRYRDKGSLATIGRARGVAQFGERKVSGIVAWWLWLAVHIFFLIGFRNRFVVMLEWSVAYWTYARSNRVILASAISEPSATERSAIEDLAATRDDIPARPKPAVQPAPEG